jgi:tight adherence protein B
LPYLIDLLKSALESGHTMLRALQMAGQNLPEPVSGEPRLIVEQVQLGMTLALEAMYGRAPVEESGFLVAAVRVQTDVGNSMAEVFQHVAEGMRNRQRAPASVARAHRTIKSECHHRHLCSRSSCWRLSL